MRMLGQGDISGTLPEPTLQRAPRGFRGIALHVFRDKAVDFVASFPNHGVTLQLSGGVDLEQRRSGRTSRRLMQAGDITVTPIGEPKLVRHGRGGEVLVLHIAPFVFNKLLQQIDRKELRNVELLDNFGTRDARIEALARGLLEEFSTEDFATGIAIEAQVLQLAVHLLRHYSTAKKWPPFVDSRLSSASLRRAVEYIDASLQEDLTIGDIAEALDMSTSGFAHAFTRSMGLSPHQYVIERRIERAKSLLMHTDLAILDIARRVGYSGQSHFSMAFRRITGMSPGVFRRRSQR